MPLISYNKSVLPLLRFRREARYFAITALFFFIIILQSVAAGGRQTITLSVNNAPLEKVFKEIQKQSGYSFIYTRELLQDTKPVSIKVSNVHINEAIALCLKEQPVTFTVVDKMVIIKPKTNLNTSLKSIQNEDIANGVIDVRGVVADENGAPAQGVNIIVKGTSKGTTTNLRGEFLLNDVNENSVLLVTSVGYDRQEVLVRGKSFLSLQLKVAVGNLDELQVIAYGATSKRLNTGNVATVKAADIEKQPVNNVLLALQGRVPGLFIQQSTGLPGSGVTVRIQGRNSISKGNDPLYIIDGVPFNSQLLPNLASVLGSSDGAVINGIAAGNGNPLNYLNPLDIESVEILKDADATAIYGSRAANGAILITTKRGKAGQTRVDLNIQTGWGKVTRKLKLLNTEQYLEMRNEAFKNDGLIPSNNPAATAPFWYAPDLTIWDTTRYTDWQKELIGGTAKYRDVHTSISGGNSNTQFVAGGGYRKETTVFPGDLSDNKASLHFNIKNSSSNQRFVFQLSGNYLLDDNRLQAVDLTQAAIKLSPNAPSLYNSDGSLNWETNATGTSTWENPLSYQFTKYKNKTSNLIGNAIVGYKLLKELDIKVTLGYTSLQTNEILTSPLTAYPPEIQFLGNSLRSASYTTSYVNSWIVEPQITYNRSISKGVVEVLLGTTFLENKSNLVRINGTGFNSDLVLEDIKAAAAITADLSIISQYKYNAGFARVNYNWLNKYIFNVTARRDGSSRFGNENRFHNFGSIAAAWVFSNESFIQKKLPFISFGKIKASIGTTGSDQIGDYQYLNLFSAPNAGGIPVSRPYQGVIGLQPNGIPNPYLEWEETRKFQVGLDLGCFNDRILLSSTYFLNRSSNQLLSYKLPITTGFPSINAYNFPALVQNSGWELTLNTINFTSSSFSWSSNINLTIPQNKLISFPDLETSSYVAQLKVGHPIKVAPVYHYNGVDPVSGVFQFFDKDGNATSNPNILNDRVILINTFPKLYGGLGNNIKYKNVELDILFQFVKQAGINYAFGDRPGFSTYNQPSYVLDRWKKAGDVASIQKYSVAYSNSTRTPFDNAVGSDAGFSDASFVRLKNLSISWYLPSKLIKNIRLNNVKVFALGQNLCTITEYKGLDPENRSTLSLPPLRIISFGIHIGL